MSCVELGFVEKIETWKLRSKFFPSKVGGFPSWLDLENLPSINDMQCKKCEKPLVFLCQIYAPFTEKEDCFHRTIFVFVCREGSCNIENNAANIQVYRCQLPRKNKFYSFEPSKEVQEGSEHPGPMDFVKLCRVCGSLGPKVCGNCKLVTYCSRDHQSLDWKSGHKTECKDKELKSSVSEASQKLLFREYEIDLEPEELEENEKKEEEILTEYEELLRKGQKKEDEDCSLDEKDLIKMAAKETDKQFAKFRTRIDPYPDQIIRYEKKGKPLLVSSDNVPQDIPPCELCGEERIFEFQIMPQLLVHMEVDSTGKSIDWGTILVYTCSNSCTKDGVSYLRELAFKQDYTPTSHIKSLM